MNFQKGALIHLIFSILLLTANASYCPRSFSILVGSSNNVAWEPDARGEGLSFLRYEKDRLKTLKVIPTSVVDDNPSFIAVARPNIYVVKNSVERGSLTKLTRRSATSGFINQTVGLIHGSTAHVSVLSHRRDIQYPSRIILVANYGFGTGSSIMSFIDKPTKKPRQTDMHVFDNSLASMGNPSRQEAPHPHMVLPYGQGTIVPDLGSDIVWYFSVDRYAKIKLVSSIKMKVGDGPRHAVVHHQSDTIFVVNELSLTVSVIRRGNCYSPIPRQGNQLLDCGRHDLLAGQTLPDGDSKAAAIRLSKDGRFLYVSIRFPDKTPGSIVVFSVHPKIGNILDRVGQFSTQGVRPRDFIIIDRVMYKNSCTSFVAVTNVDSDEVVLIERNSETGSLKNSVAAKETVYDANTVYEI